MLIFSHKKLDLGKKIKEGCKEEGLVGLLFNTIGVRSVVPALAASGG